MQVSNKIFLDKQQGVSVTGLIAILAVIGLFAVVLMKVFPSYMEYRAVREGIVRAKAAGNDLTEIHSAFNKHADINNISAITARDLVINRDSGTPEISFAYEKRISFGDRVALVINYEGTTNPSGVVEAKAE